MQQPELILSPQHDQFPVERIRAGHVDNQRAFSEPGRDVKFGNHAIVDVKLMRRRHPGFGAHADSEIGGDGPVDPPWKASSKQERVCQDRPRSGKFGRSHCSMQFNAVVLLHASGVCNFDLSPDTWET